MADQSTITLSFPEPEIALLTLDAPERGANILSRTVLDELSQQLDRLDARPDVLGLVILSAKPGIFIAGADLREFLVNLDGPAAQTVEMCRRGQQLFARLSRGHYLSVAAIDGVCVGGGTELACWCDRRIASDHPRTEIGLPEVKLGIYPGWGGTARLPRLVGLGNAVEMITSGESISAHEGRNWGLVSDIVPAQQLLAAAIRLIRLEREQGNYLADRQRWNGPLTISDTELAFLGATASAVIQQQTQGNYPAPVAALETMLGAARLTADAACELEAAGMSQLFGSEVNRSLLNVFFLTDRNKKDQGIDPAPRSANPVPSAPLTTAGVIGAGIMGAGIAAANLKRNLTVFLTDAAPDSLARGARGALEEVAYDRQTKGPSPAKLLEFAPRLRATTDLRELAQCDLVIEAVVENPQVKQQVYQQLEPHLRDTAILASNTSTIPIARLAEVVLRPERFCGMHFFNPVRSMKLVEVIRGPRTSDDTVLAAVAHVKRLGKFPVVCNDGPGFLVNRLLFPYMNEALTLAGEGVPLDAIDKVAKKFGMPMGPIELYDMVGMDTALYAGAVMRDAFPERMVDSPILPALVQAGRLGRKSGKGFFSYENKKQKRTVDPSLREVIGDYLPTTEARLGSDLITARLFLPMLLEATYALAAGIVRDPRDVDLGLIYGIGFPPFKGGLLFWADRLGIARIMKMLEPLQSLGPRFTPSPLLEHVARTGSTFYSPSSGEATSRSALG